MPNLKLTNIQILRGLAAVWVVLYHSLGLASRPEGANRFLTGLGQYGYFGVDIFFVLSGFVIYYSVHLKNITAREFFRRRAERIVPPYFVLTTILFLAMLLLPSMFHSLKPSLDHFLRSVLYLSFTGYQFPVLYIGWTLEYEMLFYVLAAGALGFGAMLFNRLPALISTLVLLGMASTQIIGPIGPVGFLTNPIILEFCFGFVIASIFLTKKIDKFNIAALTAAIVVVTLVDPTHRVMLAGLPSAALLIMCLMLNHLVTLPRYVKIPLCAVGDASYSIYLIQVFSLPLIDKLFRYAPGVMGAGSFVVLAAGSAIISGWAFFKLVETPILNALKVGRQRAAARLISV